MPNKTLDLSATPVKAFLYFTGTWIAFVHIIFLKLSLLCAYIVASQCDILCLSETVLDSVIISDDVNLDIPGHNLVRADYPANAKRGGVCLYFRKSLPLRIFHIHFF